MKKILLLFLIGSFTSTFSQTWNDLTNKQYNNANPKNGLSQYFKKEIPKRLLKDITYSNDLNYITLAFYINKENTAYGIKINSFRNKDLNEAIIKAFKNYPLESLNIENLEKDKLYYLQVIAKKGNKNIINCSNKIISKKLPSSNSCNDLELYEDIETCLEKDIRKHFYNNINFNLADNLNTDERISINIDLDINEKGELVLKKIKAPNVFQKNIEDVVKLYPNFEKPAIVDGENVSHSYNFSMGFKKGDKPTYKEYNERFDSIFKPNSTNNFALFIANKLNSEDLKIANLNRIRNKITLNFELDSKKKPFNVRTNSRSSTLDKKIIDAFKAFNINQLNFSNISPFNSYFTQILSFENDTISVETNSIIGYERVPVFPGCESTKSTADAKSCFSKNVQIYFAKNFDAKLPNKLGLTRGRKRVFIGFKINKEGNIIDINVRAPHFKIKEEVIKVMNTLPKVQPGMQGDKFVNVKYSIPFTLIVQ